MESTKQKLPENVTIFFKNLSNLLETKLLYFGSVQREDYFPGNSDIDVDIFTENVSSTLAKMQHFLHAKKIFQSKLLLYKLFFKSGKGIF